METSATTKSEGSFSVMNHPTQEQWMEYLYDEIPSPQTKELETHLKSCSPCREKRAELEGTAQSLDRWRVEVAPKHEFAARWQPGVKWAAAAAILVTTAFATGRMSRPEVDLQALQTKLAQPIEESVERQIALRLQSELQTLQEQIAASKQQLEQFARTVATVREEDQREVFALLKQLETRQSVEYRKLRENLETVALLTDQSLKDAQRKLVQLA